MDKQELLKIASSFVENSKDNLITEQVALSETVVGMKMFEAPIFAFGAADDEYFRLLKEPSAIGEHFLLPQEWLLGSKTVISFFLPFTEAVKRATGGTCSGLLKNGCIEGQASFFLITEKYRISSEPIISADRLIY